jgi:hypothetical protein
VTPTDAPVTAFVYAAAPGDPNATDAELANVYATVTELNHFADPEVPFVAHYGGPEGPKVESRGLPFTSTYLMPLPERTAGAFRDCLSHLAGYVAHDLTTPLGHSLEQLRARPAGSTPARSGRSAPTGVVPPRAPAPGRRTEALPRAAQGVEDGRHADRPHLRPADGEPGDVRPAAEADVVRRIGTGSRARPEGGPGDQIDRWLSGLEAQLAAPNRRADAASWSRAVWEQARDLIGTRPAGEGDSTVRRSRTSKVWTTR